MAPTALVYITQQLENESHNDHFFLGYITVQMSFANTYHVNVPNQVRK